VTYDLREHIAPFSEVAAIEGAKQFEGYITPKLSLETFASAIESALIADKKQGRDLLAAWQYYVEIRPLMTALKLHLEDHVRRLELIKPDQDGTTMDAKYLLERITSILDFFSSSHTLNGGA
jgi:hypothetical protein